MNSRRGPDGAGAGGAGGSADGPGSYHRSDGGANEAGLWLGLSSGTSMDAIDAALVSFSGHGIPRLEAFRETPYDGALRSRLRNALGSVTPRELGDLDVALGEAFAAAAVALLEAAGREASTVRAIGSHGQTLAHRPPREPGERGSSLQVGSPSVVAERTGIATVGDFRARDMAAGGQGAPLVPLLDHRLYTHPRRGRVALNLGGIANVTGLPPAAGLDEVIAFDTGPGNALLDAVARERGLEGGLDRDGAGAASGRVHPGLLEELLEHPFLLSEPPRSADLEEDFLEPWRRDRRRWEELPTQDLLRTLTEFTAATVADGVERFLAPRQPVDEVLVSGGGARNRALMAALAGRLAPAAVRPIDDVVAGASAGATPGTADGTDEGEGAGRPNTAGAAGRIPGAAKEAVLFATLARETLAGRPGNVPGATGARRLVVLGVVVPGG